jgi:predicted hexulose-6-phosphate isomerase
MLSVNDYRVGLYEKALPGAWDWDRRLSAAAEAGYRFVEISIDETDGRLARLDWTRGEMAAFRRAVEASGTPVLTMCLSGHRKYPLGSKNPATAQRANEIMRKAIDFSVDAGVRIVQVAGYDAYYEPSDADTRARYIDALCQAAEWAGAAGVMLALENVDADVSASLVASMDVVRAVGSPWFQMYADMANVAALGFDPVEQLPLCGDSLVAIHVKDGRPNVVRGVPFGTGIVPFEAVFATLARMGFCGLFTVEMWADLDPSRDPLGSVAAAREFVDELLRKTFPTG